MQDFVYNHVPLLPLYQHNK